jgi:hypothetical protein
LIFVGLKSIIRDFSVSLVNQVATKVTTKIACKRNKKRKFKHVVQLKNEYAKTLQPYDQITVHDPKYCGEYVTRIHEMLLKKENDRYYSEFGDGRKLVPINFISQNNRTKLIDFLYGLYVSFKIADINTLFIGVQIFDRFSYRNNIPTNMLQLVGSCSLLMGEKMEEIYPTLMEGYVKASAKAFSKKDMEKMERAIAKSISYQ